MTKPVKLMVGDRVHYNPQSHDPNYPIPELTIGTILEIPAKGGHCTVRWDGLGNHDENLGQLRFIREEGRGEA